MKDQLKIGDIPVGRGSPCYVVAEIGINHNGSVDLALQLVDVAARAGCDAVKFQKRTVDLVYSPAELARPRKSPFGDTNGDLKRGLEFGREEYLTIAEHCRMRGLGWFASCWDPASVAFLEEFDPPCYKIASACLTDSELLAEHRATGRPVILSTGMSTLEQVDRAVEVLGTNRLVILHCTSTYPTAPEDINLNVMETLRRRYGVPIGYSGHEEGIATTIAAVALGACLVERHITMDRSLWGSDQSVSLEPDMLTRLVAELRTVEVALGDGVKRVVEAEKPIQQKLRRVA